MCSVYNGFMIGVLPGWKRAGPPGGGRVRRPSDRGPRIQPGIEGRLQSGPGQRPEMRPPVSGGGEEPAAGGAGSREPRTQVRTERPPAVMGSRGPKRKAESASIRSRKGRRATLKGTGLSASGTENTFKHLGGGGRESASSLRGQEDPMTATAPRAPAHMCDHAQDDPDPLMRSNPQIFFGGVPWTLFADGSNGTAARSPAGT